MKRKILTFALALTAILASAQTAEHTVLTMPEMSLPYKTANCTHPRMKIIGSRLYVPTVSGLYSVGLGATEQDWKQEGFKGQQIIEFVKNGSELIAITRNQAKDLMLYSSDNGKTFTDIFPQEFLTDKKYTNITRIVQDPTAPRRIYALSPYVGIIRSEDFGKTWRLLSDYCFNNNTYTGFEIHPLDNQILVQHGESVALQAHMQISYDGGETWIRSSKYPEPEITMPHDLRSMDNCIHDITFHPTDPETWVFGGEGVLCKTSDRGKVWEMMKNDWRSVELGYMYSTAYDSHNRDIIYSAGVGRANPLGTKIQIVISLDNGETWQEAFLEYSDNVYSLYDMAQDEQNLYILERTQIHRISKQSLLEQLGWTGISSTLTSPETSGAIYNLQGQRLSSEPKRGFFIKGKKKIINK